MAPTARAAPWSRNPHGVAIAALVLGALFVQRSLLRHAATHVWAQELGGNDGLLHVWALAWGQHAMATQPTHLFDANIFSPQPGTLLYSDHLLALAAMLSPLRLITDNMVLVHNIGLLGASVLNAVAMYALAFSLTGRVGAAFVGAVIYAFAPFRFQADRHQIQLAVAWWPPLLLLWGRLALTTAAPRWAGWVAVGWTLQALTGIYMTAYFAPFWGLALLWWAWQMPPWRHPRPWRQLLASHLVVAALVAPTFMAYQSVQTALGVSRSAVLNALLCLQPRLAHTYLALITCGVVAVGTVLCRHRTPEPLRRDRGLYVAITIIAVALAFGPALPMPLDHGWVRGPYWLLMQVPGFTALRAPGRMLHIAIIGFAVLGAGVVAALSTGRRPVLAALAAAAIGGVAFVEGLPPKFPLLLAPPPRTDPIVQWLTRHPVPGGIVELPFGTSINHEQVFQYRSIGHWQPIANGGMGIFPPLHGYLTGRLGGPFDASVAAELRALGITRVVSHTPLLTAGRRAAVARATRHPRPLLKLVRTFPDTSNLFAIRPRLALPPTTAIGEPLPRDAWRLDASVHTRGVGRAIDGDLHTAWRSWGDLEHRLLDHWHDPTPFLIRWSQFLRRQPARLHVTVPAPTRVTAVLAELRGSDPMALAALTVETSIDGVRWSTIAGQFRPLPDVRALIADAPHTPMLFRFGAPTTLRHIRIGSTGYEWQIVELQLLRAPAAAPKPISRPASAQLRRSPTRRPGPVLPGGRPRPATPGPAPGATKRPAPAR